MKTEVIYRGFRITLNPYDMWPGNFGYSIYEGDSDKYILSTKGPAGNYDKALSSAKKQADLIHTNKTKKMIQQGGGGMTPITPTQKFILTRDNAANGTVLNTTPAPAGQAPPGWVYLTKQFKKGDIVNGTIATQTTIFATAGKSLLVKTSGVTTTNGVPYVELAFDLTNGALVPYNRRNLENISAVSNNQSSSYLGESIIAKKSQQTKNILVIIAMLAILIVAYLAVTGKQS